jgi:hypothetical protein
MRSSWAIVITFVVVACACWYDAAVTTTPSTAALPAGPP